MIARDFLEFSYPLRIGWMLLFVGVIFLFWRRAFRWGRALCLGSMIVLNLGGAANLTGAWTSRLEGTFPPVKNPAEGPDEIVVLGGGASEADWPDTHRLSGATLARVVEGVRLFRAKPGRRIWFSGAGLKHGSEAALMARTAELLGVPVQSVFLDEKSANTAEQARWMRAGFSAKPFFVVTSASHMPRVMAALEKLHVTAVPAPCDYTAEPTSGSGGGSWIPSPPSSHGLKLGERSISEWLATWKTLRELP